MRFVIVTHVPHTLTEGRLSAYGPYVREMNIWGKHVATVEIVAPLRLGLADAIDIEYNHPDIVFTEIPSFHLLTPAAKIKALLKLPAIVLTVFAAMRRADHIHLRCPGNIGLIGCVLQILFPSKPKTAKYAGNWDPNSKQPLSYKIQKWLLNNAFLTRNMKVLVYGKWTGTSTNILPFFTATYKESDKDIPEPKQSGGILKLLFVGTLSPGKQPLYAVQIARQLTARGYGVTLDFFGEGSMRAEIERYVAENKLSGIVTLWGNQNEKTVRRAYKSAHFVLLPSRSEGWPKVLAEAMFWGCVPAASPVSCVPYMLGEGSRGLLLSEDVDKDCDAISAVWNDASRYKSMSDNAVHWSRQFTLDAFGTEIGRILSEKRQHQNIDNAQQRQ